MNKKKIKHFKCNHTACILHSFFLQEYCFSGPGWIFLFFFWFCFIFSKITNNNFQVSKQFHRTHSVLFLRCIELWTKAVLSSDGAFLKSEEWSPETWAKPCKNEQHIGSIKDLRPPKISNQLTFKPQMTANQYAAKRRIYKRPDQQKYTQSRHTEFCKADRTTWKLTLRDAPKKLSKATTPLCFWFFRCRVDVLQS